MKLNSSQPQKHPPQHGPRVGFEPSEVASRLLDLLNMWQVVVTMLALVLILNGFLFFVH